MARDSDNSHRLQNRCYTSKTIVGRPDYNSVDEKGELRHLPFGHRYITSEEAEKRANLYDKFGFQKDRQ